MKITFELVNEQRVNIISEGKIIGHIFSPAGSGQNVSNAIQVCGFEEAFDLWGCGVFGEAKPRVGGIYSSSSVMKKDIQLLFKDYTNSQVSDNVYISDCSYCYNKPCTCEDTGETRPYSVKRSSTLNRERKLQHVNEAFASIDYGEDSVTTIRDSKEKKTYECPNCSSTKIRYIEGPEWVKRQQEGKKENTRCDECGYEYTQV